MKHSLKISALVLSALVTVFLSTCKKDNNDNNENPPIEWVIGTKTTVEINASTGDEVTESVNGLTFMFPDGGSGTLEVAPIISGVAPLIAGSGYYINFTGTDKIRLILPKSDTATTMVWGYGEEDGLMHDYTNSMNTWVAIPYDSITPEKRAYLLVMPQQEMSKDNKAEKKGYNYTYITTLHGDDEVFYKYEAMKSELKAMIKRYLDTIQPGPLKDLMMERRNTIVERLYWAAGPSYDPYWMDASEPACKINMIQDYLNIGILEQDLAHESGHYMMHLMVGDDKFKILQGHVPHNSENHGIGTYSNRMNYCIEETAYLSEYFQNGDAGAGNPEEPRNFLSGSYNMPDVQDFPGIEGYGIVLFAGLHRTNPIIKDANAPYGVDRYTDFPVIGAPFKDIFEIQGKGATDIDQLRTHIEEYLISKNKGHLAIPFFQRLGWGYHNVHMTFVDPQGNKLSNVSARSICIANGKTWYGPKMNTVTGADGNYILKGVFGGTANENGVFNKVRVYRGTEDSADVVALPINWNLMTNEIIGWGLVVVDLDNPLPPYLAQKDYGIYVGPFTFDCPQFDPQPEYIPLGALYNGGEDDWIICQSNGAGSITINYTIEYPEAGTKETCTGNGSVIPHHIEHDGFFDTYYYTFNINFTYKKFNNNELSFQFDGTVTGIDHLDPYMNSDAVCIGTMTRYWVEDDEPQSCSYTESFNNFILHNPIFK
jgi:hypothetical protein